MNFELSLHNYDLSTDEYILKENMKSPFSENENK
jgi:hypothetical protein